MTSRKPHPARIVTDLEISYDGADKRVMPEWISAVAATIGICQMESCSLSSQKRRHGSNNFIVQQCLGRLLGFQHPSVRTVVRPRVGPDGTGRLLEEAWTFALDVTRNLNSGSSIISAECKKKFASAEMLKSTVTRQDALHSATRSSEVLHSQ